MYEGFVAKVRRLETLLRKSGRSAAEAAELDALLADEPVTRVARKAFFEALRQATPPVDLSGTPPLDVGEPEPTDSLVDDIQPVLAGSEIPVDRVAWLRDLDTQGKLPPAWDAVICGRSRPGSGEYDSLVAELGRDEVTSVARQLVEARWRRIDSEVAAAGRFASPADQHLLATRLLEAAGWESGGAFDAPQAVGETFSDRSATLLLDSDGTRSPESTGPGDGVFEAFPGSAEYVQQLLELPSLDDELEARAAERQSRSEQEEASEAFRKRLATSPIHAIGKLNSGRLKRLVDSAGELYRALDLKADMTLVVDAVPALVRVGDRVSFTVKLRMSPPGARVSVTVPKCLGDVEMSDSFEPPYGGAEDVPADFDRKAGTWLPAASDSTLTVSGTVTRRCDSEIELTAAVDERSAYLSKPPVEGSATVSVAKDDDDSVTRGLFSDTRIVWFGALALGLMLIIAVVSLSGGGTDLATDSTLVAETRAVTTTADTAPVGVTASTVVDTTTGTPDTTTTTAPTQEVSDAIGDCRNGVDLAVDCELMAGIDIRQLRIRSGSLVIEADLVSEPTLSAEAVWSIEWVIGSVACRISNDMWTGSETIVLDTASASGSDYSAAQDLAPGSCGGSLDGTTATVVFNVELPSGSFDVSGGTWGYRTDDPDSGFFDDATFTVDPAIVAP